MILHQPEIYTLAGHTTLWARIEVSKRQGFFPEYLWYRVPEAYGDGFIARSDAFLIDLVLPAMVYGEEIRVKGAVSPQLAYQLEEYVYLLGFYFPNELRPIEVHYDLLAPPDGSPKGVASTFTGGVDSLFTVWKHLPQNQPVPEYQITHGVFIHGFDLLPSEKPLYDLLYAKFREAAGRLGIDLIPLETNAISLIHRRLPLHIFYGPLIAAAGVALSGLLKCFYIPSSRDYPILQKDFHASNPLMDRLLSTETLEVSNHGTAYTRMDKIALIADWDVAQELLWVCERRQFVGEAWNCSRCEKCFRTMIPIYALGQMDRFRTFQKPIQSNRDGLWWARKYSSRRIYNHEILPFVREHKPGWMPWLIAARVLGTLRYGLFVRFMPGFMKKWLRRYGYFIERNEAPNAYENPQIIEQIKSIHDHPPA